MDSTELPPHWQIASPRNHKALAMTLFSCFNHKRVPPKVRICEQGKQAMACLSQTLCEESNLLVR
jgi:hypothetical protein